ncbi:MAG: hypothetical protein NTW19_02155 [Planctomycetota bacterium]|nr:hypothetical protein [Planctomycetota bacterium]
MPSKPFNWSGLAGAAILAAMLAMPPRTVHAEAPATQPQPPAESLVDWPIFPEIPPPPLDVTNEFHPRLKEFWEKAIERPELDNQRQAIAAIIEAAKQGMPGLSSFEKPLTAMLDDPKLHPVVRQAVARALDQLDVRSVAPSLLKHNLADGQDTILLTDPPLARWRFEPAIDVWRKRIADPATPAPVASSAIVALGVAHDAASGPRLAAILGDSRQPSTRRLTAARALALIAPPELEDLSQSLLVSVPGKQAVAVASIDRLLAATVLRPVRTAGAKRILLRLAMDAEPAVAGEALRQLYEIDPKLIEPLSATLVKNLDATVRRITVDALEANPSPTSIATLTQLLDDPIPLLRYRLRDYFIKSGRQPALAAAVREGVKVSLTGDANWRALEQAAQVAGKLDYKFHAPRLLVLADHERAEVRLAALAALRWLEVPDTFPVLAAASEARRKEFKKAQEAAAAAPPKAPEPPGPAGRFKPPGNDAAAALAAARDREIAQIYFLLGAVRYKPVEPLMRSMLPKPAAQVEPLLTRAAAFWAIGFLQADASDKALVSLLDDRARDDAEITGESSVVRTAALQSLIRMGAMDVARKLAKDKADLGQVFAAITAPPGGRTDLTPLKVTRTHLLGFIEPLNPP